MLIILSGPESIQRKLLSRKLLSHLNTFEVDGHTVDFKKDPIEVFYPSGKLVYQGSNDTIKGIEELLHEGDTFSETGYATFQKILKLEEDVFLKQFDYSNVFGDPLPDFGLTGDPGMFADNWNKNILDSHTYSYILNSYQNRIIDKSVITGSFSKLFIDRIRQDLGTENVTVINITRHPSVSFLLNEKTSEYYSENPLINPVLNDIKLRMSLLNNIRLKQDPSITTIKFEDIMVNGHITVLGVEIPLSDLYTKYNSYLSTWETENYIPHGSVSDEQMTAVNSEFSNFDIIVTRDNPAKRIESLANSDDPTLVNLANQATEIQSSFESGKITSDEYTTLFSNFIKSNPVQDDLLEFKESVKLKDILPIWNAHHSLSLTVEQINSAVPKNLFTSADYSGPLNKNEICNP